MADQLPYGELFPPFFQPGQTHLTDEQFHRESTQLVDLFYLRATATSPAILTAVTGCLDGHLDVVMGEALQKLPDGVRAQVNDFQVSHRSELRMITGRELTVYAPLYSMEQNVQAQGFNDALYLHTRLNAHVMLERSHLNVVHMSAEGWLTVGRLDVLFACQNGFHRPFHPPIQENKPIISLLVPTAPLVELKEGRGIGLAYPMVELRGLQTIGNMPIFIRMVYDVLVQLQEELRQEGVNHPFTQAILPVPSRKQLEAELSQDGYVIKGNEAIRYRTSNPTGEKTFLEQLRRLLPSTWGAEQITLPPQATPQAYQSLLKLALEATRKPADIATFQVMSQWLSAGIAPEKPQPQPKPVTAVPPPPKPAPPPRPVTKTVPKTTKGKRPSDWQKDFETPLGKPAVKEKNPSAWTADFENADPPPEEPNRSEETDWRSDFEDNQ